MPDTTFKNPSQFNNTFHHNDDILSSRRRNIMTQLIDGQYPKDADDEEINAALYDLSHDTEYMDRIIAKVSPYPDKVLTGGVFNACRGSLTRLSQFIGMDWREPDELDARGCLHGDYMDCPNDNYEAVHALQLDKRIFTRLGYYRQGSLWSILHEDPDAAQLNENLRRYWAQLVNDLQCEDINDGDAFDVVRAISMLKAEHNAIIALANVALDTHPETRIIAGNSRNSIRRHIVRLDQVQDHPEAGIKGDIFRDHSHVCSLDYLLNTYVGDDTQQVAIIDLPGVASQFLDMVEGYKIAHFHVKKHVDNIRAILHYIYNEAPHRFDAQPDVQARISGKEFVHISHPTNPNIYRIGTQYVALLHGGIALDDSVYEQKLLCYDFNDDGSAFNNGFNISTASKKQKQQRFDDVMRATRQFMSHTLHLDVDKLEASDAHNIIIVSRREPSKAPLKTAKAIQAVMHKNDALNAFIIFNNAKRTGTDGYLAGYNTFENPADGAEFNPLFDTFDALRHIGQDSSNISASRRAYVGTDFMAHERVMQIFAYFAHCTPTIHPTAFGYDGYVLHGAEFETMRQIVRALERSTGLCIPVGSWDVGHIHELATMNDPGAVFTKDHQISDYEAVLTRALSLDRDEALRINASTHTLTSEINTKQNFYDRLYQTFVDVVYCMYAYNKEQYETSAQTQEPA